MKAEALWQFGPQGQTRAGDCGPRGPSWGGPGAGRPRGSLYSWRLLCGGPASPPVSRPSQDPIQTRGADGSPQTCLQTDIFFQVPRGLAPGQGRGGQGRRPLWLGSSSHPCASRGFIPHPPTTQASWTLVAIEPLTSDLNKGRLAAAPSSSDLLGTDCLNSDPGQGVPTK